MEEINFKEMGLDRYEVLCALYNESKPLGLGMLHFVPGPFALEEAHELLDGYEYADYVNYPPPKGGELLVFASSEPLVPTRQNQVA